jgi:hypothetical protein
VLIIFCIGVLLLVGGWQSAQAWALIVGFFMVAVPVIAFVVSPAFLPVLAFVLVGALAIGTIAVAIASREAADEKERKVASAKELEKLSRLSEEDIRLLMKGKPWNPKEFLTDSDYRKFMAQRGLHDGSVKRKGICPECQRKVVLTPHRGQIKSHVTGGERCAGKGRDPVRIVSGERK